VLIGVVFLIALASEILIASARASWAWLHILMGVLFVGAAIWAFVGLLLILRGSLDLVTSIDARDTLYLSCSLYRMPRSGSCGGVGRIARKPELPPGELLLADVD